MKKRSGPKGPRPDSVATFIRRLILDGAPDDVIRRKVRRKFPSYKLVTSAGKSAIMWHRWKLRTQVTPTTGSTA